MSRPSRRGAKDASPRPRSWSRWQVALRLARRQVRRAKGSSLLVATLVALPVIALSGGAVFADSHMGTPAQHAAVELGHAQSWISIVGGADPSRRQAIDQPQWTEVDTATDGTPVNEEGPEPTGIAGAVPTGTRSIPITRYGSTYVDTATGVGSVETVTGAAWDPALAGRYLLLSGRAVASDHEAMVSPGLLTRLGAHLGDEVTLTDAKRSFTIVGTIRQHDRAADDEVLFLPTAAADLIEGGEPVWFFPDWQPDAAELATLNHAGYVAYARDLVLDPPTGWLTDGSNTPQFWTGVTIVTIVVAFGGYLIVLLAGAAFAVAARRQQRALAMATSVGAGRGDVFRVVLLQGTVLGGLGGIVGSIVGVGLSLALLAVTDRDVPGSFWGHWGVNVPWAALVAVLVFAVLVGTLAAIAPARGATRGNVLGALRGARRPPKLRPNRPLWAVIIMAIGVVATLGGATGTVALNRVPGADPSGIWHGVLIVAIVIGPLIFQIAMIVAGHWTLSKLAKLFSRAGLAARIASRDAAASPSRVVPAFAAIAACVFVAAFAMSVVSMNARQTAQSYGWTGQPGTVSVSIYSDGDASDSADALHAAKELIAGTGAEATAPVFSPSVPQTDDQGDPVDPKAPIWSVAPQPYQPADCTTCDPRLHLDDGPGISVIAPEDLETVVGPVPRAAREALSDGQALSIARYPIFHTGDTHLSILRWDARAFWDYEENARSQNPDVSTLPTPVTKTTLPLYQATLRYPQVSTQLVISPETAHRLGITLRPAAVYADYATAPTASTVDALTASARNTRIGAHGGLYVFAESGPTSMDPVLWLIVAATMVLVFGAGSVCLGLARFERRPDDATLTAVGAGRRVRRRIEAWQALTVIGIGTVVGTMAGTISAWGLAEASDGLFSFAATPWAWLVTTAVGLPMIMAAASWLIPPRTPELTRRTAIA